MKSRFAVVEFLFCFLSSSAQTQLWGTTHSGGANNWGSIFAMDSMGGNFHITYNFDASISKAPLGNLCLANNGCFYGITGLNQFNHDCFCFKYNPVTGTYTNIHDFFSDAVHGRNGRSGLVKAANNLLYGLCTSGGVYNAGVIYSIDPSNDTYTDIFEFDILQGANPVGSLCESTNGLLYGITINGGLYQSGVIFSFDILSGTYTKLFNFPSSIGSIPFYGSLMQASNGLLYGVSEFGGMYNYGKLFSFDINSNTLSDVFNFDYLSGAYPFSNVMEASDGNLYGMTHSGGTDSVGVLFEFDINSGNLIKLVDFNRLNGAYPTRKLIQLASGKLVGTTQNGGIYDQGVLFTYDIQTNIYSKLIDFVDTVSGTHPDAEILETPMISSANIANFALNNNVSSYPNPASTQLTISLNAEQKNISIKIINVLGEVVIIPSPLQGGREGLIDISSLPQGIYFIEVTTVDKQVMRSKVIKE